MSITKLIRTVTNAAIDFAEEEIQKKNTKKAVTKAVKKKLPTKASSTKSVSSKKD